MRAVVCDRWCHYSELKLLDVAPPALPAGCVRIRVHHACVTFGQTLVVEGRYQRKPPHPFSPGSEVSGVVIETAPDVTAFQAGDRVAAAIDWGGYAEEAIATQETVWRVPDAVGLDVAASLPITWGTSYAALHWRAGLQAGQTLLVFGAAGGVGLAAVQLGRRAGARVIAVAGSQERVDIALAHGAHLGIVHGAPDLGKRIKALNGGEDVDVVYDPVGGELFMQALRCTAPEGRILVVGFAGGDVPRIPANLLLVKNIDVIGFFFGLYIGWGARDERRRHAPRLKAMMDVLFAGVERGELRPASSASYPLHAFREAFDSVVQRRSSGRVLLDVASG
jgi:NADPH2:quinone reductase